MMPSQSLPPSALEAGLLGSLTSLERLTRLQISGIGADDFAVWQGAYKFIAEYAAQYNAIPSPDLIKSKWEEWDAPIGDFEYWLAEFLKRSASHKAELLIKSSLGKIAEDPDMAIPELAAKLATIQFQANTHVVATDASIADRLEKYENRKAMFLESGGAYLIGIETGLDVIDKSHQGWMQGELVGFYARPTVGKTWMLVREAAIAWARGYKVLLISPEVSAKHIALRIDVFLANSLGLKLSHKRIFEGNPSQQKPYEELVKYVSQSERWWTVDSLQGRPLGIRDIRTLVHELRPDIVCIDGVMLLKDDERGNAGWEKMEHICYGLKNMATAEDIVVMMSHQAVNLNKGRKEGGAHGAGDDWQMPTLNDAAGGEGFVRACSTIFTMAPDKVHPNLRWYSLRKSRERAVEEWKPRYPLGWDVDAGNIVDLSEVGDDLMKLEEALGKLGGA